MPIRYTIRYSIRSDHSLAPGKAKYHYSDYYYQAQYASLHVISCVQQIIFSPRTWTCQPPGPSVVRTVSWFYLASFVRVINTSGYKLVRCVLLSQGVHVHITPRGEFMICDRDGLPPPMTEQAL